MNQKVESIIKNEGSIETNLKEKSKFDGVDKADELYIFQKAEEKF